MYSIRRVIRLRSPERHLPRLRRRRFHPGIPTVRPRLLLHNAKPMDYVLLTDDTEYGDLKDYPVLFYPHGLILTERRAKLLRDYAEKGL